MSHRTPSSSPDTAGPVGWVHAGRLRAAERELLGLLGQVAAIAGEGRNPSASGAPYTPLAAEAWQALGEVLQELAACARQLGELAGPSTGGAVQGLGATRAAVSARLAQMEDSLKDIDPARLQARYGDLPPGAAARLGEVHARLQELLGKAREVLP